MARTLPLKQNSSPPVIAVSIEEASKAVGLSRATIYTLVNMGKLKPRKVGKRSLVLGSELEKMISEMPSLGPAPRRASGVFLAERPQTAGEGKEA